MDSIVFVLMDDTDYKVPQYMPIATTLAATGVNFTNHFVASPVCSPSRASLMTGLYPHNTGVEANDHPRGGISKWLLVDNADIIFGRMNTLGYYVVFIGKFQNHYQPSGNSSPSQGTLYDEDYVPAGVHDALLFDEGGYKEFDYEATCMINGVIQPRVDTYGGVKAEADYATRVMADFAVDAVGRAAAAGKPLFMIVCPFSTHSGGGGSDPEGVKFPPDPLDREDDPDRPGFWGPNLFPNGNCGDPSDGGCLSVQNPGNGDESFNTLIINKTAWHSNVVFDATKLNVLLRNHRNRVRMAQSVSRMFEDIIDAEVSEGLYSTTWNILASDNGYHLGEHVMVGGKSGPYDHDTKVPLIIRPPGGTTGRDESALVSGVDMFNTWLDIAGATQDTTRDGRSIKTFVVGSPPDPSDWRKVILTEFMTDGPTFDDFAGTGNPPTSRNLRWDDYLFANFWYSNFGVPLGDGAVPTGYGELYRLTSGGPVPEDQWQTVNQYGFLSDASRGDVRERLDDMLAATGTSLWNLQKLAMPELTFGEESEDPENIEGFFVGNPVTGVMYDLSTFVSHVESSDPTTAAFRGDDIPIPYMVGRIEALGALPDKLSFALNMWTAGGDTTGPILDNMSTRASHRNTVDTLSRYFTTGVKREIRKRFDTNWRRISGRIDGSIAFKSQDDRASRLTALITSAEGSWSDLTARSDTVDFDPIQDEDTGLWYADLWFNAFAGSTYPLQFYILELWGKMFDPQFENIGPGLALPAQYMQHIGAPARLTIDTLATTAIFDQPDDLTFETYDDIEQVRRPYGCFPILWPDDDTGMYGVRVTVTDEPGRGAQVVLTGYRRYWTRG